MNIFADRHHSGLYTSLSLLLEKRLGHTLFSPIGQEWQEQGYWKMAELYNNAPETITQFLGLGQGELQEDGFYKIFEGSDDIYYRGITLDKFMETDIDVIVCTLPQHIDAYRALIRNFKPKAKLVYQIGNVDWHSIIPWDRINNVLASVKPFPYPEGKNVVFYRQEFDLEVFKPFESAPTNQVTSFVNCLPNSAYFHSLKGYLAPEYDLKSFGQECPDGIKSTTKEIASVMDRSKFGYHNKPEGDGFGHVIHNWFAIGRPVIVNANDYKDKLGGDLLEDGKTCISLDGLSALDLSKKIKGISDLEYADMTTNVKARFKEVVDFDKDAGNVRGFMENLQ
jgi:hypothetical protein